MPSRRLNFTGRKRIRRADVGIQIVEDDSGFRFHAELRLSTYAFAESARVFVEARKSMRIMRFDYGTIGDPQPQNGTELSDFSSWEGLLFRVKVVDPHGNPGLLLGEADQIRAVRPREGEEDRIPLLPVASTKDIGEELYRIDFDGQQTMLVINASVGDWAALAEHPLFGCLVLPNCLRQILLRILLTEQNSDMEDMEDWQAQWLRFAHDELASRPIPDISAEQDVMDWVDECVERFCRDHKIMRGFARTWTGEEGK